MCLLGAASLCQAARADHGAIYHGAVDAFAKCEGLHGVHVVDGGSVVCLRGKIDPAMFVQLLRQRQGIGHHPYVVISGIGGYFSTSMGIVKLLDPHDPVPVVGDMCASACAQFLFLMGRQRVLLHCADLAMHGGPFTIKQALAGHYSDKVTQRLVREAWAFRAFYRERHVSMDMVNRPPPKIQKRLDAGKIVFWPWSIRDLRRFGVSGIVSANDPALVVPSDYTSACIARHATTGHR